LVIPDTLLTGIDNNLPSIDISEYVSVVDGVIVVET
jgi:hypothetical protein